AKKVVLDKMDGYIEKPVDESSLLDVVMEIYGKKLELGESESKFVHPAQDIDLEQINDSTMSLNTKPGLAGFYEPGNAFLILVVEDNPVNLLLTQNILKQLGLNSVSAVNGEEAIYTFKSEEPTLILMDCHMPIMDGLSATKKIRQIEKQGGGHVPIIALSASSEKEDSDACIAAGMDDYLSKPFNKKQLIKIIQPYLKQKNANIKTVEFGLSSEPEFNARILLVEDNQINQEIAIHFFKQLNLNVEVAHDGLEAINKIKENELTYDCVFMDVKMPVMDGFAATRSIRRDTRFQSLPIIAMTAHAMKGDRERCLDAGMNDYISKPIGVATLDRVLRKWVGSKEETGNTLDSLVKPQRTVCGSSFPKLPGIDVPDDYRGERGQEEFYRKMLVRFHQENHQFKRKIQGALEAGDVKLAQFLIHSIRGSASALGAKRLSVAAEHIESLFRKSQKNIDNTLWNGFFDEMEKVLSSIQTLKTRETEL
ncbi:MAG: response regulator, partial [bacterium]